MNKFETAKKKRELALQMLKSKKTNEEIKAAVGEKFGKAISSSDLSDLRASIGMAGKNRKRPSEVMALTKPEVWVPNNLASPRLQGTLKVLLETMHRENVVSVQVAADGTVKLHSIQEFLVPS